MDSDDPLSTYSIVEQDIEEGEVDVTRREFHCIRLDQCSSVVQQQITHLLLDYNELRELPKEISCLTNLKVLSLVGNELYTLPNGIAELELLENLNLGENQLNSLPDKESWKLRCLKSLNLAANSLTDLPQEIFVACKQLQEVYLNENFLESLPSSLFTLATLSVLEVNENKLRCLPCNIGESESLEIFSANNNLIEKLPESMKDLKNLKILSFSNNWIKELPDTFASKHTLEKLFMDDNIIQILPPWFGELKNIEVIQFNNNKLIKQAFTDDFCESSTKLKVFKCGSNFMEDLPKNFGLLKNLTSFHVGSTLCELERRAFQNGNWLVSLPDSFTELTMLTKCHLDENQIQALPDTFGKLVNLNWLDLGQNRITKLPDSFCELESLEYLQLAKNPLLSLPENFGNLIKLVELRLDSANLEELPKSFSNLVNLQVLDLFNNKLREIPWQLFKLKQLIRLDLDQNYFGLDIADVPKIMPTNNYPKRDPTLIDNWRGKTRLDKIPLESVLLPSADGATVDELSSLDMNGHKEVKVTDETLVNAMKQAQAIWRTHTGSATRTTNDVVAPKHHEKNANKEVISTSDDEFEPVVCQSNDTGMVKKFQKHKPKVREPTIIIESEEDWDSECAEEECTTKVERILYPTVNNVDPPLNPYPPAEQANSSTGYYDSLLHHFYRMTLNGNEPKPPPVMPSVSGQFDDFDDLS